MPVAFLPGRALLTVSGEDRVALLQGLVSNDVTRAAEGVWAALLTPQGKWRADFFLHEREGALWLDVEAGQAEMIRAALARFRLRSRVAIEAAPGRVWAGWGGAPMPPQAFRDPRHPLAGWRGAAPEGAEADAEEADYDAHRLALGLPDGSRDMEAESSVLLEAGFDELNGVSWTKGCYMGQELTARTKYRGLVKRRLVPVRVEGPLPPRGAPITGPDGAECGQMRSGRGARGLALLRLEALRAGAPLSCGEARLTPDIPAWMRLPEPSHA
ncbi:CAF17-like 4Fe-4S cluster assembly/insertion protein YgfZ [Rubritepida flocculans]|uniref:CAF17-like 4Fe-4S cluster assembly/insertion protein YgfZ n=1 Tax=Rubritepida flocculans TaxID=182403 RepID=UPI00040F9429|nr:folate-binding protein YgfZ [Rubritepida flocculans]